MRRGLPATAAAAAGALLLTGCGGGSDAADDAPASPATCASQAPRVSQAYDWGSKVDVDDGDQLYALATAVDGPAVQGARVKVGVVATRRTGDVLAQASNLTFGVVTSDGKLCRDPVGLPMLGLNRQTSVDISVRTETSGERKDGITLVVLDEGGAMLAAWRTGGATAST